MFDPVLLREKLKAANLSPRFFLNKFRFLNETHRNLSRYTDPFYLPFYYWLGRMVAAKHVVQFGVNDGIVAASFLEPNESVEQFLAFQQESEEYYSPRIPKTNIQIALRKKFPFHIGNIMDEAFQKEWFAYKWDCALVTEEFDYQWYLSTLNKIWDQSSLDAIIVVDRLDSHEPAKRAFSTFCQEKSRKEIRFPTRYGIGVVWR